MVTMPMGVDDIAHRGRTKAGDRGGDLAGERGKLVIDQHRAVRPVRYADIAALPEQDRNSGGKDFGPDLDFAEVRLLGRGGACDQGTDKQDSSEAHLRFLSANKGASCNRLVSRSSQSRRP